MVYQVCWFSSWFSSWWWCFMVHQVCLIFIMIQQLMLLWYTWCAWFSLWFSSWCCYYGTPGVLDFHYGSAADVMIMVHLVCLIFIMVQQLMLWLWYTWCAWFSLWFSSWCDYGTPGVLDFHYGSAADVVIMVHLVCLIFIMVQQLMLWLWYTWCAWFSLWFSSWCCYYGTPGVLDFHYGSAADVVIMVHLVCLIFIMIQQLRLFLWYTRCAWFSLWFSSWCFYGTPGVLDFHYDSVDDVVFMVHQGCWNTTTLHSALPKAWPSAVNMQVLAQHTDSMTRYLTFAMSLYADKV